MRKAKQEQAGKDKKDGESNVGLTLSCDSPVAALGLDPVAKNGHRC